MHYECMRMTHVRISVVTAKKLQALVKPLTHPPLGPPTLGEVVGIAVQELALRNGVK